MQLPITRLNLLISCPILISSFAPLFLIGLRSSHERDIYSIIQTSLPSDTHHQKEIITINSIGMNSPLLDGVCFSLWSSWSSYFVEHYPHRIFLSYPLSYVSPDIIQEKRRQRETEDHMIRRRGTTENKRRSSDERSRVTIAYFRSDLMLHYLSWCRISWSSSHFILII